MKNKTFWQSIRCAIQGLKRAFESEKNFKIYLGIVFVTMLINGFVGFSAKDYIAYTICACGVLSAEFLNTAIEFVCDFLTEQYEEKVKDVKDIAAGAVLIWGIGFWVTEFILIGENLFG